MGGMKDKNNNDESIIANTKCYFRISIAGKAPKTIVFDLHTQSYPKTCANFLSFCKKKDAAADTAEDGGKNENDEKKCYKNTIFHRIIPNFMVQGGDYQNHDGTGGEAYDGGTLLNEVYTPNKVHSNPLVHDGPGILSMANKGRDTAGSQFFITLGNKARHLDGKHVAFGTIDSSSDGMEVLREMEQVETDEKDKPVKLQVVKIVDCGIGNGSISSNSSSSDNNDDASSSVTSRDKRRKSSKKKSSRGRSRSSRRERHKSKSKRKRDEEDSSADDSSDQNNDDKSKQSDSDPDPDSGSDSSDESSRERRRRKRKHKRRHDERKKRKSSSKKRDRHRKKKRRHSSRKKYDSDSDDTNSSASTSSRSDDDGYSSEEEERRRSNKKKKHKKSSSRHGRRKETKKSKKSSKSTSVTTTSMSKSTPSFGQYGILKESTLQTSTKHKRSFEMWLAEVKSIPQGSSLPKYETAEYIKEYIEDFNTATLPNMKYYDYDKWEVEEYEKQKLEAKTKSTIRSDEFDHVEEMRKKAMEKKRKELELTRSAMSTEKVEEMKRQARMKAEMVNAYRTGDEATRKKLQRRLEPDEK